MLKMHSRKCEVSYALTTWQGELHEDRFQAYVIVLSIRTVSQVIQLSVVCPTWIETHLLDLSVLDIAYFGSCA